jgi:methane/ammonia monooxygenase subunit A
LTPTPSTVTRTRGDWALALVVALAGGTLVMACWVILAADWNFWTDWKDRVWWPLITAPATFLGVSTAQYVGWRLFRVPLGTAAALVGTVLFSLYLYISFSLFASYPANFVWLPSLIPTAILADVVMVRTGRWRIAVLAGGLAYGLLFYAASYAMITPFLQPVVVHGRLLTLANLQGLEYWRSSAPEYLRSVQIGGIHTLAGQSGIIASVLTGAATAVAGFAGAGAGHLLAVWPIDRYLRPNATAEAPAPADRPLVRSAS